MHRHILCPGRNQTSPPADSAGVPATGRQPSPQSTRAVIMTALAVPALHTPASSRLAPTAIFSEDTRQALRGVTPNFILRVSRLGNIRERPCAARGLDRIAVLATLAYFRRLLTSNTSASSVRPRRSYDALPRRRRFITARLPSQGKRATMAPGHGGAHYN